MKCVMVLLLLALIGIGYVVQGSQNPDKSVEERLMQLLARLSEGNTIVEGASNVRKDGVKDQHKKDGQMSKLHERKDNADKLSGDLDDQLKKTSDAIHKAEKTLENREEQLLLRELHEIIEDKQLALPCCLAGWAIASRSGPDAGGYTMVSPSQVISCDGFISEWHYLTKRSYPFRAIIWRPVTASFTEFKIVGINDIPAGAIDEEVTFQVPSNQRIAVEAGDMIGWSFEHGVLAYNLGGGTPVRWIGGNLHASLAANQIRNFNGSSGDREYSIQATVTSDIRLAGGTKQTKGRVEIYHDGAWGTVCDDGWGDEEAVVVCRELGFADPNAIATTSAQFGEGDGRIWLDDVSCTGCENQLSECSHLGFGTHNCGHHEDAGVICVVSTCSAGWAITSRSGPDAGGYTMVSPSQVISCDGFISEWHYQAKRSLPFRAIVWRPVTGSTTEFKIIGINYILAGAINIEVTFYVPFNQQRIAVKDGDMIGWSFEEGVLAYNLGGGTLVRWIGGNLHLAANQIRNFNGGSGDREYSIRATVQPTPV